MKYGERYDGRKFRTEFMGSRRAPAELVGEFCRVGSVLDGLGLTPENAGNISVRAGGGMFITVGGVNKGRLTVDDIVEVVLFDGESAGVIGVKEPSSETPMHWGVYLAFPEAGAVIHVHDDAAVDSAQALQSEFGVLCTREFVHYGSPEQAAQVVDALRGFRYAVIRGHGVICYGHGLSDALELVKTIYDRLH